MTWRRAWLAVVAVLVAVAGIVVPRVLDGEDGSSAPDRPGSSSPTTGATSGTEAASTSSFRIPAVGAYRYHYARSGDEPAAYEARLTIAGDKDGYVEARDHQTAKIARRYTVSAGGVQETGFTLTIGEGEPAECRWNRPFIVVPPDPKAQQQWTSVATCSMRTAEGTAQLRLESTATVHGTAEAKLGEATVPLLRIDRKTTLRTTVGKQVKTRVSTVVDFFDQQRGLLAQQTVDATETSPSGTLAYRIIETMLTTEPEGANSRLNRQ